MWNPSSVGVLVLGGTTLLASTTSWSASSNLEVQRLGDGAVWSDRNTILPCELKRPHPSSVDLGQTYAASYPGSGSEMSRVLIESLTGIKTTTARKRMPGVKVDRRKVAIKSHYPAMNYSGYKLPFDGEITRCILLFRNPMKALPSWHNFIYERENGLPDHSTRAPLEEWTVWRDERFATEIVNWRDFVVYWMDRIYPRNRMILSYEDLTDYAKGPAVTTRLARYLSKVDGVDTTMQKGGAECVWKKVVHYKDYNVGIYASTHRRGPSEKPYSKAQLIALSAMLKGLANQYASEPALHRILRRYIREVLAALEVLDQSSRASRATQ